MRDLNSALDSHGIPPEPQINILGFETKDPIFTVLLGEALYQVDLKAFGPELALEKKFINEEVFHNTGNLAFSHQLNAADFFNPQNFLGYTLASLGYNSDKYTVPADMAYIIGTAVIPEAQGRGLAQRQRENVLQHCFELWRVQSVITTMRIDNEPMKHLNEKFGATVIRELGKKLYSDEKERVELEITRQAWIQYAQKRKLLKLSGLQANDIEVNSSDRTHLIFRREETLEERCKLPSRYGDI